jgi:hypothetical protein
MAKALTAGERRADAGAALAHAAGESQSLAQGGGDHRADVPPG